MRTYHQYPEVVPSTSKPLARARQLVEIEVDPSSSAQLQQRISEDPRRQRRRLQNRTAQRAFRERKEQHVQDLAQELKDLEAEYDKLDEEHQKLQVAHRKLGQVLEIMDPGKECEQAASREYH
jgi:predicted nuclease with TOPRIM domain